MITDLYRQSVLFKRYHSDKRFSEFLFTRWRQKVNWHRCVTELRHCHSMYYFAMLLLLFTPCCDVAACFLLVSEINPFVLFSVDYFCTCR